uniref:Uncharacterized protein n=1 Tax=Romanomermis culicivorax TaxID=13658 RepID=A0A915HXM9_ROMCU
MLAKPYFTLEKPALCFCYISNLWSLSLNNYHNIFVILMQITTACIYGVVYRKNKQILKKFVVMTVKNNLNERFAQWANVKISKWLTPLTLISALLNISFVSLTTTLRTFMEMDFWDTTTLALSLMAAFSVEALIFPLLCIRVSYIIGL